MASLRDTLENAIRTGACTLLDIPDAVDRLVDFGPNGTGILGQLDDFTDGVRNGYRDAICPSPSDNPYSPNLPTPVLPGATEGNCPVTYIGRITYNSDRFGNPALGTGLINGPGARARVVGDTVGQPQQLQLFNDAGNVLNVVNFVPATPGELITIVSTEFVRQDGQPDNCPEAGPFPPPRIEEPITYEPPTGSPITITPIFNFNPIRVTVNNNVIIPVAVAYADVDITANLNLNIGRVEFNFGGGNGDGGDCCLPPNLPELPPADPDDPGPPSQEQRISAVIITVTSISDDTNVTQFQFPSGPSVFFPDLGLITFRVRIDDVLSWTAPIRIQYRRQLIPVPWPDGAVDVAGLNRPGVNFTITTVFDDYAQLP